MPVLLSDLVAHDREYRVGDATDPVTFTFAPVVYPVERAVSAAVGGHPAEPAEAPADAGFDAELRYAETLARALDGWVQAYGKSWTGVVDDAGEPVPLTLDVFQLWRNAYWRDAEALFWKIYRDRERVGTAGNPSGRSPGGGSAAAQSGAPNAPAPNRNSRARDTAASAPAPKTNTGRKTRKRSGSG